MLSASDCLRFKSNPSPGQLSPIRATEFVGQMRGRSHPCLLRCENGSYYVVKSHSRARHSKVRANEMFAGRLAILLGLPVCDPKVVEVPHALGDEIPAALEPTGSVDFEFGSAFPHPPDRILVADFLPDRLLRRVTNIDEVFLGGFVFDLWTCNFGRREAIFTRPVGEDGIAYSAWLIDQDACFKDNRWELPEAFVPPTYGQRAVYEAARTVDSFEPFLTRIEKLGAREIEYAARTVPPEWCGSEPRNILILAERLFHRRRQIRQATADAMSLVLHRANSFASQLDRQAIGFI